MRSTSLPPSYLMMPHSTYSSAGQSYIGTGGDGESGPSPPISISPPPPKHPRFRPLRSEQTHERAPRRLPAPAPRRQARLRRRRGDGGEGGEGLGFNRGFVVNVSVLESHSAYAPRNSLPWFGMMCARTTSDGRFAILLSSGCSASPRPASCSRRALAMQTSSSWRLASRSSFRRRRKASTSSWSAPCEDRAGESSGSNSRRPCRAAM